MTAVWPPGLPPGPLIATLEETTPDLVVRTPMSVGPAKVRRRATVAVRTFAVEWRLTRAQVALLDDWFVSTLEGGALPFEFRHPRTADTLAFRFVERPAYAPRAPRLSGGADWWAVRALLELVPTPSLLSPEPPPPEFFLGGGAGDLDELDEAEDLGESIEAPGWVFPDGYAPFGDPLFRHPPTGDLDELDGEGVDAGEEPATTGYQLPEHAGGVEPGGPGGSFGDS